MTKKIIFSPLLIFAITSLWAAEPLTLKQCLSIGLEQSYQMKIVRNQQDISTNNFTPGNAGYLPKIDLAGSIAGTEADTRQVSQDGSATISQTGVSNQSLSAGINLNWTLFDGFNIQANYGKLRELQQSGVLQTRMEVESYIADLAAEYYNYVRQTIRLKNLESAVKLSRERLRIVEARYHIGNMSRLDLQQARVYFNTDSSVLIRQHEVLFSSRVRINQLMSVPNVDAGLQLADSTINFDALLNRDLLWQQTLQLNTYLKLAEKEKNIRVLELQSARSANYPWVRLNAGYGYTQNNYEFSTNKLQNNLGINYGISFGYNIFDGLNNSRKQKNARIEVGNQELVMEELRLSLKSDFANLWMAYNNNMQLTVLEKQNLTHALENLDIAMERYRLGELSGIELREAQNSLLEAEERLLQAQYATKLSEISLLVISGEVKRYL